MNFFAHLKNLLSKQIAAFTLVCLLGVSLLFIGILEHHVLKTIIYMIVMLLSVFLSEFLYFTDEIRLPKWKIKHPKKELKVVLFVVIISCSLLVYWFVLADRANISNGTKMILMAIRILFVFPVFYLVYFLAFQKYSLRELGILRFKHWFISLPIIVLIGGTSYLLFPEGLQFRMILEQQGVLSFFTLGFLTAAIPEEIARNVFQTRLGAVIKGKGIAWFLVSFIWAMTHIPSFAFTNQGDYYAAFISALGILPIGLLWGYLNERYKSIIPSVLIHGTNLWGLQNIF